MAWHDEMIEVIEGEAFVRGTQVKVSEVQEVWSQPGIYAHELRCRFPALSEAQLGAAVAWRPAEPPLGRYWAHSEGPPLRRYEVTRWTDGWSLVVTQIGAEAKLIADCWEETGESILLQVARLAPANLEWRDDLTGDCIDLSAIAK